MKRSHVVSMLVLGGLGAVALESRADTPLLTVGDYILAIDPDSPISNSSYPAGEAPPNVLDANTGTKYLNFGQANSGFIVQPASGPSIVHSMVLTTANDSPERDPASYAIYGTNDAISSLDNSLGNAENWTLIATGSLTLPDLRLATAPVASFSNTTSYTAYRVVFPTVKNPIVANSMQVSGVALYTSTDGTGTNILGTTDLIRAVDVDVSMGSFAGGQGPPGALDALNIASQYRNVGGKSSGFIVTPWLGSTIVTSFQITTPADNAEQDPTSWALYGTNDLITSGNNSAGTLENWTLIAADAIALPTARATAGPVVTFSNSVPYRSYKLQFTALRDTGPTTPMHIGKIQFFGSTVDAVPTAVLSPVDPILAADLDFIAISASSYPAGEAPLNVLDGNSGTKYLNFAKENSGFIVTPAGGASTVQSVVLTTAGDATERDPASVAIYGTNDAITSADNSLGIAENWTLIASAPVDLPTDRNTVGPVVSFANATAYTSYKVIFPTLRNSAAANSMQVADVALYQSSDGSGSNLLSPGNLIRAVDSDPAPTSSFPAAESPANAINNSLSKYLNFGAANSGFIVTPTVGLSTVTSFRIVSGNDAVERDPTSWSLWGTNDPITDVSNSTASKEHWVLISSGNIDVPMVRDVTTPLITFTNTTAYTSYLFIVTAIRLPAQANSMQLDEVQFYGKVGLPCPTPFADVDEDGDVDQEDFGLFQACYTGPSFAGTLPESCRCFDATNKDSKIDSVDYAQFVNCFSGPAIQWTQAATPDCTP